MDLHICVPVLKRYDLLRGMLTSLAESQVKPTMVWVIDNGRDSARLDAAVVNVGLQIRVRVPGRALGVAESWNWFLHNVPEDRVIVNDDTLFAPDSLEKLLTSEADLSFAKDCGFACFMMRNSCIKKIGYFDETISPGYAYYEDDDYLQRVNGRGTREASASMVDVDCHVTHLRSQTLTAGSPADISEHHRKFKIAQRNYMRKWGLNSL